MDRVLQDCLGLAGSAWPGLYQLASSLALGLPRAEQFVVAGRTFEVQKQLGEGGYAYVYLVRELLSQPSADDGHQRSLACKKVLCECGEVLEAAKREANLQSQLQHPNLLPLLLWGVSPADRSQTGPQSTALYMLSPAYPDGTLAAEVEALVSSGRCLPVRHLLHTFAQLCRGLSYMHAQGYAHRDVKPHNILIRRPASSTSQQQQQRQRQQQQRQQPLWSTSAPLPGSSNGLREPLSATAHGDAASVAAGDGGSAAVGNDVEAGMASVASADSYEAVLMDFGSARPRVAQLDNRSQALALQEDAEAHCSAPYRAPELFDVPSPASLDMAAADVWAAGATLFHAMTGLPPFHKASTAAGGSLALAVLNCSVSWPTDTRTSYPQPLRDLVMICLNTDWQARPSIDQVLVRTEELLAQRLPDPPAAQ